MFLYGLKQVSRKSTICKLNKDGKPTIHTTMILMTRCSKYTCVQNKECPYIDLHFDDPTLLRDKLEKFFTV